MCVSFNACRNVNSSDFRSGVCKEKDMTVEFFVVVSHEEISGYSVDTLELSSAEDVTHPDPQ